MALVATVDNENESSDVESCADSETETQVYSKLTRSELVDSMKELKTHFVSESEKVNTTSCSEPEASST